MDKKTQKPNPNDDLKHTSDGGKGLKLPTPSPKTGTTPGSQGNPKVPFRVK